MKSSVHLETRLYELWEVTGANAVNALNNSIETVKKNKKKAPGQH
jgi:hypothetical protein